MLHDLSRQLRRLMKTRSDVGQRSSSTSSSEPNVIRLKSVSGTSKGGAAYGARSHLLMKLGARMHARSVEQSDGCAIAILDHRGVVRAWHDSLPDARTFDFGIVGAHVSQFYLPHDVVLLRPDRNLLAACVHGSTTQHGWHRRPNGSVFWAVTIIEPIYLESAELKGYSHVTRFSGDPLGRARAELRDAPRQCLTFHGAIAAA